MYGKESRTQLISTHSLTRRLTMVRMIIFHLGRHFNSQPHEEADQAHHACPWYRGYFNSQPHEEADY